MSVTHIAGVHVNVDGRVIQRCALCGEKLIDSAHSLNIGFTDASGYPVFQAGTLVRQRDDGIWEYAKPQAHSLPNDNCLPLVEM
jgi:hypothetical protein